MIVLNTLHLSVLIKVSYLKEVHLLYIFTLDGLHSCTVFIIIKGSIRYTWHNSVSSDVFVSGLLRQDNAVA